MRVEALGPGVTDSSELAKSWGKESRASRTRTSSLASSRAATESNPMACSAGHRALQSERTLAVVRGEPSGKRVPPRSTKVHSVPVLSGDHDAANAGRTSPRQSTRIRVPKSCRKMSRSLSLVGRGPCERSTGSDRAMVRVSSCPAESVARRQGSWVPVGAGVGGDGEAQPASAKRRTPPQAASPRTR